MICEIEDCGQPELARGLCVKHYWRMKRGRPLAQEKEPTVRIMNLRLSKDCGEKLSAFAADRNTSLYAVVKHILEDWARSGKA